MEIEKRLPEVLAEVARSLTGLGLTTDYGINDSGGFVDQAGSP